MKAAMRERYGGPDVVSVREVERPVPEGDQVVVHVRAASVNRADLDGLYPRWGFVRLGSGIRAPKPGFQRLGIDVAGVVESVGERVAALKPGDDVFSDLSGAGASGAFAEYVCAPERSFATMPAGLSYEQAACLPHSGILALRAFDPRGGRSLKEGERVLVVGASGSVGPFCVQMAKSLGAHVTGVASGDKLEFVRSLGADHAIDYETTDSTRPAERYDWIVDVNAHHPLRRWIGALNPGGVYLSYAGSTWWLLSTGLFWGPVLRRMTGKHMGLAFVLPFRAEDVERLRGLAEAGTLRPVIDRRYPLEEVADALRHVDDGHARGKVIVTPSTEAARDVARAAG